MSQETFTMEDAHEIIAGGVAYNTTAINAPMGLPVEAMFKEEVFNELDDTLADTIKQGYYNAVATAGSAGIDLRYVGAKPLEIKPGEQALVSTGLAIYLKDPRFVGMMFPRSGLGNKGLVLGNLTGIIDSDYQNEIKVSLWNRHQPPALFEEYVAKCITIEPGERIAQYLVVERFALNFQFVEAFSEETERGLGGFGSTGRV